MTVRTFGRKGGEFAGQAAGLQTPLGFGQADQDMQRRVEEFLATERARKDTVAPAHGVRGAIAASAGPIAGEKSLTAAYVFWFFLGAISAHRFYLGFPASGVVQASLWLVSWMMMLGGFFGAALGLVASGIWMIADIFLIPGLHRRAVERQRELRTNYVFE